VEKKTSPRKRKRAEGGGKFSCTASGCGVSFPSEFRLRRHTKTHTGERPYVCNWMGEGDPTPCGKMFAENSTLKRHLQTHTGEKPFRCQHVNCNKDFADNVNLKRHLRLIHGAATPGGRSVSVSPKTR